MVSTKKNNQAIRKALADNNMALWQLGVLLQVSEPTITRMMRTELPEERQKEIINLIENGGK